jgi:hypothetical protein
MVEAEVVPVAAEVAKGGATTGQGALHSLGTAKAAAMAQVAAHPVAAAVIGAVVLTVGAYYIGKFVAGRAHRKAQAAA